MSTLSAPDFLTDDPKKGEIRQPISALAAIRQDAMQKPVLLGLERDPTVYSTLVEFGIIDDDGTLTH